MIASDPRVTIGLPTRNRADLLKQTIESILTQSFGDFELIIVNDGSTDNTADIISTFSDKRILSINSVAKGIPYPINEVLAKAKGEYIMILHDHDIFSERLVEECVDAFSAYPNAGFVLPGSAWVYEDGISGYSEMLLDLNPLNSGVLFGQNMYLSDSFNSPIHACCMVRAEAYNRIGRNYSSDFGFYADIDVWLRLLASFDFIYVKRVLITFRTREKVNHTMFQKDFQIASWLYSLFDRNCERFFSGEELWFQRERLQVKYRKKFIRLIGFFLLRDERDLLRSQFFEFRKSMPLNKGILSCIFILEKTFSNLFYFVGSLLAVAYRFLQTKRK
jgi:glycosyltransferase involved in cell wall biosynthesis